ncbi:MAG: cobalamin-dependent protein [Nanoarchaeota archaeon]
MGTDVKKVKLVQINGGPSGQNYLPLSAAYMQTHAQKNLPSSDKFDFSLPIYTRMPVDDAVERLVDADIAGFSTYVWNFNLSVQIAKKLKQANPDTLIVFGGPHVPERNTWEFFKEHPYVDVAVAGEGELAFTSILENYPGVVPSDVPNIRDIVAIRRYLQEKVFVGVDDKIARRRIDKTIDSLVRSGSWGEVSTVNFQKDGGVFVHPTSRRISDLNEVPSPYLNGAFRDLMEAHPEENWTAIWETNRGCPFDCSFCDWGSMAKDKMVKIEDDRLAAEQDWFSRNKIEVVWCADSNFGMYGKRDLVIAQRMAENNRKHGYPKFFTVQGTKNPNEEAYQTQKVLDESGLSRGVLIAFQSLHPPTLEAVHRSNISLERFFEFQRRYAKEGVDTFSDLIIPLPEETYESFTTGISKLIESGQHGRIQFNNLSILPNPPMADPAYIAKYQLDIVETPTVNIHGPIKTDNDDVQETQELVVATSTMSRKEYVDAKSFAYMTSLLHFDKLLQIPSILAHSTYGLSYKKIFDAFRAQKGSENPVISGINRAFEEKARAIQGGSPEFCPSEEWLGVYWYPDEHAFIDLVANRKLDQFYREARGLMGKLIGEEILGGTIMDDALRLNSQLLRLPSPPSSLEIETAHNVWELYKSMLASDPVEPSNKGFKYRIDVDDQWGSMDEWLKKMVWQQNKKGAYIYSCSPISD